jgi:hypothetical protein
MINILGKSKTKEELKEELEALKKRRENMDERSKLLLEIDEEKKKIDKLKKARNKNLFGGFEDGL